uniref:Uncharacterized protein n=1 Tax=Amphimedon queenslandica TaxID=400682 RepID=A0A1X7UJ70_AMPQE
MYMYCMAFSRIINFTDFLKTLKILYILNTTIDNANFPTSMGDRENQLIIQQECFLFILKYFFSLSLS